MDPFEKGYLHLLPRTLQEPFNQLNGKLKELIINQLLIEEEIHHDVAIIALDIIVKSPGINETYKNQRERLLVHLLNEVKPEVKTTFEKVLGVVKEGFFAELLKIVDSKKANYHTAPEITKIVSEFHSKTLPLLKQKEEDRSVIAKDHHAHSSSPIILSYHSLMKCQTYYALPKIVNEFLSFLPFNRKWAQGTYDYFFYLLNVQYNLKFDDFEKTELTKAIFHLHFPNRKLPCTQASEIDIREFVSLSSQLKYRGGEEILEFYLNSLSKFDEPVFDEMIKVLNLLLSQLDKSSFFPLVKKWTEKGFEWNQLITLLEADLVKGGLGDRFLEEDIHNILARFKKDPTVQQPLSDEDLKLIHDRYQKIRQLCMKYSHSNFNQLMNTAHPVRQNALKEPVKEEDRLLLIAIGYLAIRIEFGLSLYSTQVLALLGLFAQGNSRQAQVKTGEGKSMIVALWAFVTAMESRAADIITSARYLAIRDHDKCANFFKRSGVTTSHICYDSKTPKHFAAQILFGPAFDFEFAWMQDLLWGKKLYLERLKNPYVSRNFDAVCVDESDNLLIDTANNGARLASSAEVSYDWVYSPILSFVRSNRNLVENNISLAIQKLREHIKNHLDGKNKKVFEKLTEKQLTIWIQSAYRTLYKLVEKVDYVVRTKKDSQGHLVKVIQIVDLQTGRISENSRWSNGTHEFLEVKHDIVVQKESLTPISLSHAVFYSFYKTISALTGTAERYQTKEIYKIESFDVPPHKPLQRVDLPPIIAKDTSSYFSLIIRKTKECILAKRPILILCANIQATLLLADYMKTQKIEVMLLNECQEELEDLILSQAGGSGKVTIATNAAGRGTDIILSKESLQHGGLHVLSTFYFNSKRDEHQAIGRAGRQGQPGSSQIILNREDPMIVRITKTQCLTDQKILELLDNQIRLEERAQASLHVAVADLDRFLAEKTRHFFEIFRKWADYIEQDCILEIFAQKLCSLQLNSRKEFNFEHLNSFDLIIAEECLRLVKGKSEMLSWKVFLQKAKDRLKKKIINEWVKTFFEEAEKQLKEEALSIKSLKSELEEAIISKKGDGSDIFFELVAQHFLTQLDEYVLITKKKISAQFDSHRTQWEIYLAIDGSGLFEYLKEITTLNLPSFL